MRQIILLVIPLLPLTSCDFFGTNKSKNELRYDSLTVVIGDGMSFLRDCAYQVEYPAQRDSMLQMLDDLEDLSFSEIKEKYQLSDTVLEREFLDAISITAEIATAGKKLQQLLGE